MIVHASQLMGVVLVVEEVPNLPELRELVVRVDATPLDSKGVDDLLGSLIAGDTLLCEQPGRTALW